MAPFAPCTYRCFPLCSYCCMTGDRVDLLCRRCQRSGVVAVREEREARLLSLVDVLEPLSEEELRDLAQRCPDISLQEGEDFYRPQQHDGGLFLIKEGRVRVYLSASAGKEVTLDLLGSGTVLWARRLELVDGHAVYAQAVQPTVLAFMGREGYKLPAAYTHEELATMIGAGRVAVSRAFKELRETGAVEPGRATVRVRDKKILERIARSEG